MKNKRAILIVDDEFIILESLRAQLSRFLGEEIIVEVASSGEESMEIVNYCYENDIDLQVVISDYNLEDMKGTEVLDLVHAKYPLSQKMILTGHADTEKIADLKNRIGLKECFSKPWGYEHLKETVLNAFEFFKN